ncbi:energy transducer TonB [Arenimonas sp. MALMAid1274]|uniref:energy transducer TonB n=1 Tax=Arenimonas sp. MALMAid1274 TaxID=3411630 RepID=UPI003B9DE460
MGSAEGLHARHAARAGCVLLLAAAFAPRALAQDAGPAAASPVPLPAWLVVEQVLPPAGIPDAWKAVSQDVIPYPRLSASPSSSSPQPPHVELQASDGPHAGLWRFFARREQQPPQAAWQLVVSDHAPYRVTARLYCDEPSGGCRALHESLAWLPAPPPRNEAAAREWLRIVTDGPCEPGPARTPAPRFPPAAMRTEASGTVRVRVAFNACGQVRYASLFSSAGNHHLDRAAVQAARSWRLPLPDGHAGPGQAVVPVRFEIAADAAPAD